MQSEFKLVNFIDLTVFPTLTSNLKKKVTPEIVFFLSSAIKILYLVQLTTEVSASKVHAIPRN